MIKIKVGYEVGTGEEVTVPLSHLIVTGLTQLSGKTTTLEALIKRSGLKAIVFKTKIGEKSFSDGREVSPFFKDRSDYEFVKSLIEAYSKEKLFIEKGTLMKLSKGAKDLIEIKRRVDDELNGEKKLRGLQEEIYTRLQHYLENLIPQIQYANFSRTLTLHEGINIMNLERFSEEAQSLVIQSVSDEILKSQQGVILVIPEAWKFLSQKYNNPCKRTVEAYIRQGAANKNYIWLDSQDMAGVDKIPLKQISTWILGYQSERNEVKHTLDQIALPKKNKPKEEEIMTLKRGQFFISSYDGVKKVYVQPVWLHDEDTRKAAMGEFVITEDFIENQKEKYYSHRTIPPMTFSTRVDRIGHPPEIEYVNVENKPVGPYELSDVPGHVNAPFEMNPIPVSPTRRVQPGASMEQINQLMRDMATLRSDVFNRFKEMIEMINYLNGHIHLDKPEPQINEEELLQRILLRMPINKPSTNSVIDKDAIIREVISKLPSQGNVSYSVSPLEAIKGNFMQEAKDKIYGEVRELSVDAQKVLKYLEMRKIDVAPAEIVTKCLLLAQGGTAANKVKDLLQELTTKQLAIKKASGRYEPALRSKITDMLSNKGTENDIELVYNHILAEMIK